MTHALALFPILEPVLKSTQVDYAIGGAVAMSAYGYTRETQDLDVFFLAEDGPRVLLALRRAGIRFATIADPYHYAIIPSAKNPDHRIDLLFTSDDPEMAAVIWADEASFMVDRRKVRVRVFPATLLATVKIRSDRDKDHGDVRRMYEAGAFDPKEVLLQLKQYGEPGAAKRMQKILQGEKVS